MTDLQQLADLKFFNLSNIESKVAEWRNSGQTIVFTNGCFDLLHVGHLSYMLKAASLGNKLIVGVNSDFSVKRLKGESRPVNSEYSRCLMLASLFFIDGVVIFDEDTPLNLINLVKPDVLVKGGDYTLDAIVGATEVIQNGGTVQTIEFVSGYSSTNIIDRIAFK